MRLLLDQGLAPLAAQILRERGHDAVHVQEIGLATASDASIIDAARRDSRCVVTLDADFHALIALSEAIAPSVIRIRIEHLRGADAADLIARIVDGWAVEIGEGVLLTVQTGSVRSRRLPLTRQS